MNGKFSSVKQVTSGNHSIAILLPGFLDSNQYLKFTVFAKGLSALDYATLQLDPCGLWYGDGSEATYTVTGYLADIAQAVILMLSEVPTPKDVLLLGHSMGAFLAMIAASNIGEVTSVCSLCPPASLQSLSERPGWKENGFKTSTRKLPNSGEMRSFVLPYSAALDMQQHKVLSIVGALSVRLMLGISLDDEAVRVDETEKLVSAANAPHVVRFEGMDHHFNHTLENTRAVWGHIAEFLRQ